VTQLARTRRKMWPRRPAPHLRDLRPPRRSPVFAVWFMGSSIAMIDYHHGHLAHDSREHAVSLLDALASERAVDAGAPVRLSVRHDRIARPRARARRV